jgi:hypothetical protein
MNCVDILLSNNYIYSMSKIILDSNTKKQILQHLLTSNEFSKSQKYHELLHYLFEASINEEMIKASTLAVDFFGKEATYDSSIDSTVRSYISNLRKKLEHYYLTVGENDKYKIIIPKGDYNVEFEENIPTHQRNGKKTLHFIYLTVIAALLIFASIFLYENSSENPKKKLSAFNTPIWNTFLESGQKTLFVIGDYYVFRNPLTKERRSYMRDIQINSEEDLDLFLNKNPEFRSKIRKTYNTFLDENIPFCLSALLPVFILKDVDFDIKLSSELRMEDLQNNNIIYIGSHKSLTILNHFTGNLHFEYSILPRSFKFYDVNLDSSFYYTSNYDFDTLFLLEFPMVIKEAGPKNNSFLFFLSNNDLGNISTIKYFTNPKTLEEFSEKLVTANFEALFETRGFRREDFSIKLLHLNKLSNQLELPVK